jgi:hypothetical protein
MMRADAIYRQHLELVRALGNPAPKPVADALARAAAVFNQPTLKPVSLSPEPFQENHQQSPIRIGGGQ